MAVENGWTSVLFTFVVALLLCVLILKWIRERNYPPGPKGLPLLGYAPFLGDKPNHTLRDLSKKYGDICSFYVGPQLCICVNDFYMARDITTHPLMLSRPPQAFSFLTGLGGFGGMNGPEWQEHRRFAFHTMRNLGLGKGPWETMIQESAEGFLSDMKNTKGEPVYYEPILSINQVNSNIALLFGRHLDKVKDKEDIELVRLAALELLPLFAAVGLNISLPWLIKFVVFFRIGSYYKLYNVLRKFEDVFRKEVEKRVKEPETWKTDDFIGCYLKERQEREKAGTPHSFTLDTLQGNLFLLFIGGNDTTMAGVSWLLLLMAAHQDVQKKVHDEIDRVIGRDSRIYHDDKFRLPYTLAALYETARWVSINPIYPPRYATESFQFNGYTIPQGCNVVCNIWAIMRDPRYFKDPEEYRPERFLSEDGEKVLKLDGYAPFSFGKRNCPGDGVAIMTLFLYFSFLMQKFKVTPPPGCTPNLDPIAGGVHLPKPQKLCFTLR